MTSEEETAVARRLGDRVVEALRSAGVAAGPE
jgi:hypothetical protein